MILEILRTFWLVATIILLVIPVTHLCLETWGKLLLFVSNKWGNNGVSIFVIATLWLIFSVFITFLVTLF